MSINIFRIMERGKALQDSWESPGGGVSDQNIGIVEKFLETQRNVLPVVNEESKVVKSGFGGICFKCQNENMRKLNDSGNQGARTSDRFCQTDEVNEKVKGNGELWFLRIVLACFIACIAATGFAYLRSEEFFKDFITKSCPNIDSSSPPSASDNYTCPTLPIINSLSVISSLSIDQCASFNSLGSTESKLGYLSEVLNWKPTIDGSEVSLINLYSYKSCKYFIGESEKGVYKFSLYEDFTKVLKFKQISEILLSPDGNYMAVYESHTTFILIDIENFKSFTLYINFFNNEPTNSLFVFSLDSNYLFYGRDGLDEIIVFNTVTQERIIKFNMDGDMVVNMKASKNLNHLIVKDSKNNVKVFNIENSNFQHICSDEKMKKELAAVFPEIEELI